MTIRSKKEILTSPVLENVCLSTWFIIVEYAFADFWIEILYLWSLGGIRAGSPLFLLIECRNLLPLADATYIQDVIIELGQMHFLEGSMSHKVRVYEDCCSMTPLQTYHNYYESGDPDLEDAEAEFIFALLSHQGRERIFRECAKMAWDSYFHTQSWLETCNDSTIRNGFAFENDQLFRFLLDYANLYQTSCSVTKDNSVYLHGGMAGQF